MGEKILVIGSSGLAGNALMDVLVERTSDDVLGTSSADLDLSSWFDIRTFLNNYLPTIIYLPAAITQVDRCETDPLAHKVNVDGVRTILNWTGNRVKVIFFSSSYVFSGKDTNRDYSVWDIPHPLQIYGAQKLLSETETLKYPDNLVIRTSAIFGKENKKKNFGYQVLKSLSIGNCHKAATDQWINPILASDLAESVVSIVQNGISGVMHVAGSEDVAKYDFGRDIASVFGFPLDMIEPITTEQLNQKAKRPVNGCLRVSIKPKYSYLGSIEKFHADY